MVMTGIHPISCCGGGAAYPNYAAAVFGVATPGALRAFWRLGETASPWRDTAGYVNGPFDASLSGSTTTAPTADVTGCLPAAQDDGAVRFNDSGVGASTTYRLTAAKPPANLFTDATAFSVAAWIKPTASASTWRGGIFENRTFVSSSPSYAKGWGVECRWAGGTIYARFVWSDQSFPDDGIAAESAVTAGVCTHLVATWDNVTMRLYLNGALAASQALGTTVSGNPWGSGTIGTAGYSSSGGGGTRVTGPFFGGIDELAYWQATLTAQEAADLYSAGS
jgi:hypothetical protein